MLDGREFGAEVAANNAAEGAVRITSARDPSKLNPELFMYVPLDSRSVVPEGYYKMYGDARRPSCEVLHGGHMPRID